MVIAVVPVLVMVAVSAALVVFTNTLPNTNGDPVSFTAVPTPLTFTLLTALKKPLELMVTVPLTFPEVVGAKYTYIVQVLPLAKLAGQLSASRKFELGEILLICTGPNALTVTVWGGLVVPTAVKPKAALAGLLATAGNAEMLRTRRLL